MVFKKVTYFSPKKMFQSISLFVIYCLLTIPAANATNTDETGQGANIISKQHLPKESEKRKGDQIKKDDNDELEGQKSKKRKVDQGKTEVSPAGVVTSISLPIEIWKSKIFPELSDSDLLRVRAVSKQLQKYASDIKLWQARSPQVNLSEVWSGGPEEGAFANIALNRLLFQLNMRLVVKYNLHRGDGFTELSQSQNDRLSSYNKELDLLRRFATAYLGLEEVYNYYNNCFNSDQRLKDAPHDPSSIKIKYKGNDYSFEYLSAKGNVEKAMVQFMYLLKGVPISKDSPLYVKTPDDLPKHFVEQFSNECELRKKIIAAWGLNSKAEDPILYQDLLKNGLFVTNQDYVAAIRAHIHAKKYAEAGKYADELLKRDDLTLNNCSWAIKAYAHGEQYDKVARIGKIIARHPSSTLNHLEFVSKLAILNNLNDLVTDISNTIISRSDKSADHFRLAANICSKIRNYKLAIEHRHQLIRRGEVQAQDYLQLAVYHKELGLKDQAIYYGLLYNQKILGKL